MQQAQVKKKKQNKKRKEHLSVVKTHSVKNAKKEKESQISDIYTQYPDFQNRFGGEI